MSDKAASVQARTPATGKPRWTRYPAKVAPVAATVTMTLALACAIFTPWMSPHDPNAGDLVARLQPPAWMEGGSTKYLLGTDQQGRDVLSRMIWGARVSLSVAAASILCGGIIGTVLGLVAGYFGRWRDAVIMRLVDATLALPAIMLALVLAITIGAGFWVVVLVISVAFWAKYARLVRGEVLSLKEREFVELARVAGSSWVRIVGVHILPNVANSLIVFSALQIGTAIVLEAALSFLGAGIPPPTSSWGTMLVDGKNYVETAWWMSLFPALAMMFVVVAANTVGDVLRDKLDPKLRAL